MLSSRLVFGLLLLAATACRTVDTPDTVAGDQPTLPQLLTAWSGGQATGECRIAEPSGDVIADNQPPCEWLPAPGSGALGRVTGHLDDAGRPTLLTWERPTESAADADRLIDSLGAEFVGRGLEARDCGSSSVPAGQVRAMLWEGPALVVHLSRITPDSGAPHLGVMAIDQPASFPEMLCPRAAAE